MYFHQVAPNLLLKTMGIMCRVCRTFEAFDNSDQDLAQFVKLMVFPRCDQFLVLFGQAAHALTTRAGEAVQYEVLNADRVMRPSQSVSD
jgi:hypothetical protein